MKQAIIVVVLAIALLPLKAMAHHGGISLAFGPGTPIETNSPFTLPQGGFVVSTRIEHVEFKEFDFAEPENKDSFTFYNVGLSYGIKPYLTTSLFFPYSVKKQDTLGSTRGFGDLKLLAALGFNYDGKGFNLNTLEDVAISLEGMKKTYCSLLIGFTLPTGESDKELGGEVDRGMQPGFRSPTFTIGLAAARQIIGLFTLVADTSYDIFTEKDDFKFGNEWRLNVAGVYQLYGKPERFLSKVDGILELNLLNIARDQEAGEDLRASGGTILYISPGMRVSLPKLWNANLGLLIKFPVVKDLNEGAEQQGSEGLEKFRVIGTLSFFF